MNEEVERASENIICAIPSSGMSAEIQMFATDWKPRKLSARDRRGNCIRWWLRPRLEPILRRVARWLDFYLED